MRQQYNCIKNTLGVKWWWALRLNINHDMINAEDTHKHITAGGKADQSRPDQPTSPLKVQKTSPQAHSRRQLQKTQVTGADRSRVNQSGDSVEQSWICILLLLTGSTDWWIYTTQKKCRNFILMQDEAILKDSSPSSFRQNFAKFATTTSAHGFVYID